MRCSHGPCPPERRAGGRAEINDSRAAHYGAKLQIVTFRQLKKHRRVAVIFEGGSYFVRLAMAFDRRDL